MFGTHSHPVKKFLVVCSIESGSEKGKKSEGERSGSKVGAE